jgi:hypothetical protein
MDIGGGEGGNDVAGCFVGSGSRGFSASSTSSAGVPSAGTAATGASGDTPVLSRL